MTSGIPNWDPYSPAQNNPSEWARYMAEEQARLNLYRQGLWGAPGESPQSQASANAQQMHEQRKRDRPIPPGGKKDPRGGHVELFKLDLCGTCKAPLREVQTIFIRQGYGYCKASCRPKLQVVSR